jgi:hypothetical protein
MAEFIHDHQKPIAVKCLSTLPLDGLDPVSDVKAALERRTLLSSPRISAPIIGSVYVFLKGWTRWGDGLRWPFKTHRNARDGQDYNIYHGAAQGHLSGLYCSFCCTCVVCLPSSHRRNYKSKLHCISRGECIWCCILPFAWRETRLFSIDPFRAY